MNTFLSTTDGIYAVLSEDDLAARIRNLGDTKTAAAGVDCQELAKEILALAQQKSG